MFANGGFATVRSVRTRRRPVAAVAIAASVLLLAATACGSASEDSTGEPIPDTTIDATESADSATSDIEPPSDATTESTTDDIRGDDAPTTEAAVVVPEALQFTAPLVGGGTFDGAAVAGKPTVFWFWAPT